jgi:hypothetical protein
MSSVTDLARRIVKVESDIADLKSKKANLEQLKHAAVLNEEYEVQENFTY